MPKIILKQAFVNNPPIPTYKPKTDYFDAQLTGLLLEVRRSGTATYYLRYRDTSSRIKQIRIGNSRDVSLEEARSKARALKSQAVIGFDPRAEQNKQRAVPTFRDFVYQQYLPYAKSYKRSWELDQRIIERRMLRLWGRKQLHEISGQDFIALQNSLVQGGLKASSVNRVMALAKYIFNLAERWEIIDKAPTRNVGKLAITGHRDRFLTKDELTRILAALESSKSKVIVDIVRFLLLTGARRGEVLGLPWDELNLDTGVWTLPPERNKSKRTKIIPISEAAMSLLQNRQSNGSEYVFPNPKTGEPIKYIFRTWDRIRIRAGVPDLRIHDLRHSFASFLVNNGRSLYEVQKILGHSQISTTERYAHLAPDTLKEATEIAGRVVGIRWVEKDL